MKIKTNIGDFLQCGTRMEKDHAVITFEVTTNSPVSIEIYDKHTLEKTGEAVLDNRYRIGRLFSAEIYGIDFANSGYMLCRDGRCEPDSYAPVLYGREIWRDEKRPERGYKVLSGFPSTGFDWKKDEHPFIPPEDMVMYKLHLRGYTMKHGLKEESRGNYRGVMQRLSELKSMGFTTLEFLPLYEFEEFRYRMKSEMIPGKRMQLIPDKPYGINYWGYGPAYYFAPKSSYFGGENADIHLKEMVRKIHAEGMEIIPVFSFAPECSDNYIIDCLNYWVREYHVDGAHLVGMGLPVERIAEEPHLGRAKIFYDQYPAEVLAREKKYGQKHLFQYDGGLMYPIRRLQNHMDGSIIELANTMKRQAESYSYVNYAANNNGFTLYDVFSYSEKHNMENGEDNTDGENYNLSHNYGQEGETKNKVILQNRMKNVRMALATVFLSQGIPLVLSGDEVLNTQEGNNNAYCQDNETGWVTFSRKKRNLALRQYIKDLIAFRKEHTVISNPRPMEMTDYRHMGAPDLSYHGREPWTMWLSDDKKSIGILFFSRYARNENEEDVMLCFNYYFGDDSFALPKLPGKRKWYYVTNTGEDTFLPEEEPLKNQTIIRVPGGTLTILVGKLPEKQKK